MEISLSELKELIDVKTKNEDKETHSLVEKKVIVRTYSAGVHYGILLEKTEKECVLKDSIRIWRWSGAASLNQLAEEGTKDPENCKFSIKAKSIYLPWIEIIECSEEAIRSIEGVTSWKN